MPMLENIRIYFDRHIAVKVRRFGIPLLRISLGIVFLWFGLLKIFDVSPMNYLIELSYQSFPYPATTIILGIWESIIGLGLIFKKFIRIIVVMLWMQMIGIIGSLFLQPHIFFKENPLILTLEGEFVVKNLTIIAASLVIVGLRAHPSDP